MTTSSDGIPYENGLANDALRPGTYRHFKGGKYRVLSVAKHSETGEELVIYQALYGDCGWWVRPLVMFLERVDYQGQTVQRFSFEQDV